MEDTRPIVSDNTRPTAQIRDINDLPPPTHSTTTTTTTTTRRTSPPSRRTTTTTTKASASADVLLRSLELRESVEKELLHSVEKLVKLRHRGDAQQFRLHVARLHAQETQIQDLQSRVDQKDEDVHDLRRQLANLEQKNAQKTVQLMTVKTELHSNNVEIATDKAKQLRAKDDEIQSLNNYLGEIETNYETMKSQLVEERKKVNVIEKERSVLEEELDDVKSSHEKKTENLTNEVLVLRTRVAHAEDYRAEANRQISEQEDQAAMTAHESLKYVCCCCCCCWWWWWLWFVVVSFRVADVLLLLFSLSLSLFFYFTHTHTLKVQEYNCKVGTQINRTETKDGQLSTFC